MSGKGTSMSGKGTPISVIDVSMYVRPVNHVPEHRIFLVLNVRTSAPVQAP